MINLDLLKINVEHIVDIRIIPENDYVKTSPDCQYRIEYRKGDKILSWFLQRVKEIVKEDLYTRLWYFSSDLYTYDEVISLIKKEWEDSNIDYTQFTYEHDGILYYKPYVRFRLSNDTTIKVYKDTIEDCAAYITEIEETYPNLKFLNIKIK